jgi:hypothetical protein
VVNSLCRGHAEGTLYKPATQNGNSGRWPPTAFLVARRRWAFLKPGSTKAYNFAETEGGYRNFVAT